MSAIVVSTARPRLLRAESGGTGHAPRRGGVATTSDVCARTGGVKYGAEFATRPRGRFTMTRSVRWLFTWWGIVCLLWSLGVHAGAHRTPHVGPSTGPSGHAVPSLSIFPSTSPTYIIIRTRTDARESSSPYRACVTVSDGGGPPWLDLRGPPGACGRLGVGGKAAGHAGSSKGEAAHVFSRKFPSWTGPPKKRGFATAFS